MSFRYTLEHELCVWKHVVKFCGVFSCNGNLRTAVAVMRYVIPCILLVVLNRDEGNDKLSCVLRLKRFEGDSRKALLQMLAVRFSAFMLAAKQI